MPCSAFFLLLLLLLPPTFKGGSLRYHGPGWKLFHHLGKSFRSHPQSQMQQMRQNVPQSQPGDDCQGVLDLYLVLDKSGSVADNWIHIYSFTEGLVKKFTNPNLRLSIITYSTEAEVILPLTSDRKAIEKSLLVLKDIEPLGLTHMEKGLRKANEQIQKASLRGRSVISVIIALTDGLLQPKPYRDAMDEVKKARKMGAIIYTVGVFMYSKDQLVNIAGDPKHCFGVDKGFAALEGVIDPLTSNSCTEILSVQPTFMCAKDSYQVNISGHGFNNTNDVKQVICRFTFSDSRVLDESPSDVNEHSITCPGPKIQHTGEDVSLQVSLNNGISFIGNKVIITSTNCGSTRGSQGSLMVNWNWMMFLPVLPVTLLLLCCSWKLCIKPKEPPPPPPQPEKEPEEESSPPAAPAPAPGPTPPAPPPAPFPVNTSPTVIVACCGCGNRDMQGGCPSFTVMKPSCSQASCRQKRCLCSNRGCFHLAEQPYPTRIVLQPNEECFNITRARCNPNIRFHTSPENLPVAQTLCAKICSAPNQERYTFNSPQSPWSTRKLRAEPAEKSLITPCTSQARPPPAESTPASGLQPTNGVSYVC